jgi:hypothetical protein
VTKPEGFPKIHHPQVALAYAESRTGIVLCLDGKRFTGAGEQFMVFGSLELARAYATQKVQDCVEIECAIYDADGKGIESIVPAWTHRSQATKVYATVKPGSRG